MSDAQLVMQTRQGQQAAYSLLIARHQARIFQLCYRFMGSAADADELAHDAFVDAYLHLGRLREPAKFGAWVRTIALNLCRMRVREGRHLSLEQAAEVAAVVPQGNGPRELLAHGVWSLSPAHRLVLALHYWEGLSYDEVALFVGIPVGTVMSRLHRARRELRKTMETIKDEMEVPEFDDEEFRRVVEAEISAILAASEDGQDTQNRLSVILLRTPERFARLVASATEERECENLALLVRRVGAPALRAIFAAPEAAETPESGTRNVLARYVRIARNDYVSMTKTASRDAYILVDELLRSPQDPVYRAELLLEWMQQAEAERDALLYTVVLMRDEEVAFPLLMRRFCDSALHKSRTILYALCRTGTRFGSALIALLRNSESEDTQKIALVGAEGLMRSLNVPISGAQLPADEQAAKDLRFRLKWPAPARTKQNPEIVGQLLDAILPRLGHESSDIRTKALQILGCSQESRYVGAILECTRDKVSEVRVAAIRALEGAPQEVVATRLLEVLASGGNEERIAAAQILGKYQEEHASDVLRRMALDADPQVARAAISALGEIGGEENRAVLSVIVRAGGPLRGPAAKALAAQRTETPRPTYSPTADRVRGDSEPYTNIGLDAAIRELPEIREYGEQELTCLIARACYDFASTRRYLIEFSLMTRREGIYRFTELGAAMWRVERYMREYLGDI